jgi:hypothetical protein
MVRARSVNKSAALTIAACLISPLGTCLTHQPSTYHPIGCLHCTRGGQGVALALLPPCLKRNICFPLPFRPFPSSPSHRCLAGPFQIARLGSGCLNRHAATFRRGKQGNKEVASDSARTLRLLSTIKYLPASLMAVLQDSFNTLVYCASQHQNINAQHKQTITSQNMAQNGGAAERPLEEPYTIPLRRESRAYGTPDIRCSRCFELIPLSQSAQSPPNAQVGGFVNHLECCHADLSPDEIEAAKTAWIEAEKKAFRLLLGRFVFLPFSLSPPLTWPTNSRLSKPHRQAHPQTEDDPMEEDDERPIGKLRTDGNAVASRHPRQSNSSSSVPRHASLTSRPPARRG